MDKLGDGFKKFLASFGGSFSKWSALQKSLVGGVAILVATLVPAFFLSEEKSNYEYVFVNLSSEDAMAISSFLKKNNYVDYLIDQKGVKVPLADVDKIRIQLSQEGLPFSGVVGWEKFDEEDFTRTEVEQEIQKLRAIQGELSRTLTGIEGITSARVHIVSPKASLFMREKKEPTASIYIQTKRGATLDKKQVKGIQHLISRAVEGLTPDNIVILDNSGRMLTDIEPTDESSKQSRELINYKTQLEKAMEERIRAIVGKIVGPDRIEAKVDAEVDFTQEKQTISDINPDDVVVVSKNSSGSSMQGQGLNPTGIPGSKSNVPGEQEDLAVNSSSAGSKRETELVNYEFSKTVSQKTLAVGKILRLTISTIVDGKQIYPMDGTTPEFQSRTKEEMKQLEDLIKNSVGFKEGRDSLSVQNMMFQLDPFQIMDIKKQRKEDRQYISTLSISAVVALALILFFALIVRPYFRWLSYDPEKKEEQAFVEEYKPDLELGSMKNVQVQEEVPFEKMTPKEQVMYLAKNEPKRTTEAIRILLSPTASVSSGP